MQGATELALTKLDSLSGRSKLKICTAYSWRGNQLGSFPLNAVLDEAQPVYTELDGWSEDIVNCRDFDQLPQNAQRYVQAIEHAVGRRIRYVSVGPERTQIIVR